MDQSDIQSASTYINNLLLSRGLLRDGNSIDFARLAVSGKSRTKKEDGKDVDVGKITAQVMNLVHDLILKRDRDQTQQEQIAQSLLTLRSENAAAIASVTRSTAINNDLHRQLAAEQTNSRNAQSAARAAETLARTLREEVARVKVVLAQTKTQCANDIRKKDVELSRLQAHLSAQQRGSGNRGGGNILVAPSCTVTHGGSIGSRVKEEDQRLSVQDAEYSLRQETNEFLTQLSQSLSDENDALIGLVRGTLETLREMQGLPEREGGQLGEDGQPQAGLHMSGLNASTSSSGSLVNVLPTSYDDLAGDLQVVLDSLRDLLTNPSFASIEEVQIRDDEIQRLKDGWEKMETRWQEAVVMMKGWRKRMLSGGDTVNLDELKMGLNLGEGLESVNDSSPPSASENIAKEAKDPSKTTTERKHDSPQVQSFPTPSSSPPPPSEDPSFFEINSSNRSTPKPSSHNPSSPASPLAELTGNTEARSLRTLARQKRVSSLHEHKERNSAVDRGKASSSDSAAECEDAAGSEDELTRATADLNVLGAVDVDLSVGSSRDVAET